MKIGTKLIISFLILLSFSIIIFISTVILLTSSREKTVSIINSTNLLHIKSNKMEYNMLKMSDGLRGLLLEPDNKIEKKRKMEADDEFVKLSDETIKLTDNKDVKDLCIKIGEMDDKKLNPIEDSIMEIVITDINKARSLYWDKYLPVREQQTLMIKELNKIVDETREKELKKIEDDYAVTLKIAYTLLLFLFLSGVALIIYILKAVSKPISDISNDANYLLVESLNGNLSVRVNPDKHNGEFRKIIEGINNILDAVSKPVKETVGILQKIAQGDFTEKVINDYKGDHAILKNALNDTIDSMNKILTQVNITSQEVSSGSQHVSSASVSLSQGATEQAASVEQIASSMQQISAQTIHNAENASRASQLTIQSMDATKKGNNQMNELTRAMNEINDSSKSISKIIKVIDEIAFQTNLLALNAAIEAAGAGKYGKGFAVVAEEVRTLAARSATAAKETSELIEVAIKKAENGSNITEKTLDVLQEINRDVTKVSDIVAEIASYSNEQAKGVSEINSGLAQISGVTQQTMSSSEECASSSSQLYEQAEELKNMLSRFKLTDNHHYFEKKAFQPTHIKNTQLVVSNSKDMIKLDSDEFGRY